MAGWVIGTALLLLAAPVRAERSIDLVLVLDTTGSMSGLIDRAKTELWGIVDQLSLRRVETRVGIVAFRDRGDAYVTQIFDLSADIDQCYVRLLGLEAAGGGDTPESVNRALEEAVHQIGWSQSGSAERAIILAGDAPPHMDYANAVQWPAIVRDARQRGIAIHAIQLGSNSDTRAAWRAIAAAGGGTYAALSATPEHASGSPWDDELAQLNQALAKTLTPYGDDRARERLRSSIEKAGDAGAEAAAARASYLGRKGVATTSKDGDLVSKLNDGELQWEDIEVSQLPDELRDMPAEQRRLALEDRLDRRKGLLSEIAYYAAKRDGYLAEARKTDPARAFQRRVIDALNP